MNAGLKIALATGVPFGLCMGLVFSWMYGWAAGGALGLFSGALFGGALAAFVGWQNKKAPTGELTPGEPIRHQGPANHIIPGDATGGRLFLTDRRLYFKSHGMNRKDHELTVELGDIAGAEPAKSLGFIPNRLVVRRRDGGRETFVVFGRAQWMAALGGRAKRHFENS